MNIDVRKVSIHYNDRQYWPGEWEVWYQSEVLAHAKDLTILESKYPNALIESSLGFDASL